MKKKTKVLLATSTTLVATGAIVGGVLPLVLPSNNNNVLDNKLESTIELSKKSFSYDEFNKYGLSNNINEAQDSISADWIIENKNKLFTGDNVENLNLEDIEQVNIIVPSYEQINVEVITLDEQNFVFDIYNFDPIYQNEIIVNKKVSINHCANLDSLYSLSSTKPNIIDFISDLSFTKQFMFDNKDVFFSNIEQNNFTINDIKSIDVLDIDEENGVVELEISLMDKSKSTKTHKISISGFYSLLEKQGYTVANNVVKYNGSSISASDFANKGSNYIKQYLFDNRNTFYSNLPSNFTIDNITRVSGVTANDAKGEVSFKATINNFYKSPSTTSKTLTSNFVITGFNSISKATIINSSVVYSGNLTTKDFKNLGTNGIKNYIFENKSLFFRNLPSNFAVNNITSARVISDDEALGTLKISLSINNWYDGINSLPSSTTKTQQVSISGFKIIAPAATIINSEVQYNGTKMTADDFFMRVLVNGYVFRDWIWNNKSLFFKNLPSNFTKENIIGLKHIGQLDKEGKYIFTMTIDNYYDGVKGTSLSSNMVQRVTITGFEKVENLTTQIRENIKEDGYDISNVFGHLYASEVGASKIGAILKNADIIKYLAITKEELYSSSVYFTMAPEVETNDYEGKAYVTICLGNGAAYVDGVVKKEMFLKLEVTGFKKKPKSPATIMNPIHIDKLTDQKGWNELLSIFQGTDEKKYEAFLKFRELLIKEKKLMFISGGDLVNEDSIIYDGWLKNYTLDIATGTITQYWFNFTIKAGHWYDEDGEVGTYNKRFTFSLLVY